MNEMSNCKTVITGYDTDRDGSRTPNTIEKYYCSHCGHWKEEAEEDGEKYYCDECIKEELVKCSVCCHYVQVEDHLTGNGKRIDEWDKIQADENFVCYECKK